MISRWPWPRRDSCMVDCTRITATKKNSAARTTAAGPTSRRCRHAEFLPISSEFYSARHGVGSQLKSTAYALATPLLEPTLDNPLLTSVCSLSDGKCVCSHTAVCVSCMFFVPVQVTRLRPPISDDKLPSRTPSSDSFPFQIELPRSYIHLPNMILTSPGLDIFHSFFVPKYVVPKSFP